MASSWVVGDAPFNVGAGLTRYSSLSAPAAGTSEAPAEQPVRFAGTFKNLYTYCSANTVAANTVITLRKSQADTAVTVTYTSLQTGVKEDTSNTATFATSDKVAYKIVTGSTATTFTLKLFAIQFTADTGTVSLLCYNTGSSNQGLATNSVTRYFTPTGGSGIHTTEANAKLRIRAAFLAQNFYVYSDSNTRTTDTILRTRKNGANGGQSVTYTSTQTGIKEDTSGSDSLAAGDDYNYAITTSTGGNTFTFQAISSTLYSTAEDFFLAHARSALTAAIAFNTTTFFSLNGGLITPDTTEANVQAFPRFTFTAKELGCLVSANTIATSVTTVTLRDNGADSAVTFSYNAAQTGLKNDSVNTATITTGTDNACYKVATPNTSGTFTLVWLSVLGHVPNYVTAVYGSFALTGNAAGLNKGSKLTCAQASFTLSGQAASLNRGRYLACSSGSFSLTGNAAALNHGSKLTAAQASFVLTGNAATLNHGYKLTCAQASFALTGNAATLLYTAGNFLTAAQASFVLTGNAATLNRGRYLACSAGSFTLTGNATGLTPARKLTAVQASFTLTGNAAGLNHGYSLSAAAGSFVLSGQALALNHGFKLTAAQGSFTLTGIPATLNRGRYIACAQASVILTGNAATFPSTRTLSAGTGIFVLTHVVASLRAARTLSAGTGTFVHTLNAAALYTAHTISAALGSFTLTGQNVFFGCARCLTATVTTFVLSSQAVTLTRTVRLTAATTTFVLTGFAAGLNHTFDVASIDLFVIQDRCLVSPLQDSVMIAFIVDKDTPSALAETASILIETDSCEIEVVPALRQMVH